MSVKRLVRVNELIKREVATALYRVMNEKDFDLSAVSVTRVITSSDLRTARVFVSIRDHEQQRNSLIARLRHHSGAIQSFVGKNVIIKYTPKLTFELDESVEQGDRVLQIISEMESSADAPGPEDQNSESGAPAPSDE